MSNRNDEGMLWVLPIAIMAATAVLLIVVVYVIAVVLSFLLTLVAFAAWNRPVTFLDHTVTPEEARLFVGSGCVGLFALPLIVFLFSAVFQFQVRPDMWGHFYVAGYAFGSLGVNWLADQAGIFKDPPAEPAQPVRIARAETPREKAPEPFRYARWDDEEARK